MVEDLYEEIVNGSLRGLLQMPHNYIRNATVRVGDEYIIPDAVRPQVEAWLLQHFQSGVGHEVTERLTDFKTRMTSLTDGLGTLMYSLLGRKPGEYAFGDPYM